METILDPAVQPFLHDHQIDGTPVLPGVMAIEALAEAATALVPGWHVDRIEGVDFLAPFKFYRNEPRTLTVVAVIRPRGEELVAECRISGVRMLAGQVDPQVTEHFRGRVLLRNDVRVGGDAVAPPRPHGSTVEKSEIYRVYFHGPAYQVLERAWIDGNRVVGQIALGLPDNHIPVDEPVVIQPRLLELCFQTAGVWEVATRDHMGLPHHIDAVRFYSPTAEGTGDFFAVVTPNADCGTFDAEVVDSAGKVHISLRGYRTVALPTKIDVQPLKALHAVMA
jgi:hypothetical protein